MPRISTIINRSGFGIILVLAVAFVIMSFVSASLLFTASRTQDAKFQHQQLQCMVLAESGLAIGLWRVKNEPGFHTDPNYSGSPENIKAWLINEAAGLTEPLSSGNYKIIKEAHRKRLFSIGYLGPSPAESTTRKVLQLDYDMVGDQLIKKQWQEL
ncbi:MAG: hypothetical protein ABIH39_05415 [Candidatus Margulisiibacteriota bacterium]